MPCRYFIDKERRLVVTTGWDRLTFDEIKAFQDALLSDPDFNQDLDQLWDARAVTAALSAVEAEETARRKVFSAKSRRAFVATRPAVYGMARLFAAYNEALHDHSEFTVFYHMDEALKWLGLESLPEAIQSEGGVTDADALGQGKTT